MAFLLRAFSRGDKQKDNDSSADFVNKMFQAELSNIRSKLAVEDDDIQFLLEMIYDSSFPESQKFLKDPTKDRLFAHKETLSKLLFGLAAKGVPVTQLIVGHMQKYGIDSITDTLLTLLELIRPLLVSKEIPEFTSDDLLDAIDVQWHSPLRGGSRPQSPFQSPRTSVSVSPRFSVSSPRSPFSVYYPGQTQAQDLVSPRRSGPFASNFKSPSDGSPRSLPNSGWDASPRFKGLSHPQGQNLQVGAHTEKELNNGNLTISQRRQQSETPNRDSSLQGVSTEINQPTEGDGKYLPESKLENSVTSIQTNNSGAQERPEASSMVQHGTKSSQLPHIAHLENLTSFEHLKENAVVEVAGDSAQAQSGCNGSNLFHPCTIENQQENGEGEGLDVRDNNGRITDLSRPLPEGGSNDTHQQVISNTLVQREAGQESETEDEADNEFLREISTSDLSKEEELNTKSGVEGVPTKPPSEIQQDSLDRISKDMDDSKNSEDEIGIYSSLYERFLYVEDNHDGDVCIKSPDSHSHINTTRSPPQGNQLSIVAADTRKELGDAPIENSEYSNFVCGNSPVERHIFGNFDAGNNIDRTLHSKNLLPHSKDGQGKEVEKADNVWPRSEHYEPEVGEGDPTSFANMAEKDLVSEEKPQEGKYIKDGDIPSTSPSDEDDARSFDSLASLDEVGRKSCSSASLLNDEASPPTLPSFSEADTPGKRKNEIATSTPPTLRNEQEDPASDVHTASGPDIGEATHPLPVAGAEKQISPGRKFCEENSIVDCGKNSSMTIRDDDGEGPPIADHPIKNVHEPLVLLGLKEEGTASTGRTKTGNPNWDGVEEQVHSVESYDSTTVDVESLSPVGAESGVFDAKTSSEISSDNVEPKVYQSYVDSHEEKSTAGSKPDPKFIGDPSLPRKDTVEEKLHFGIPDCEDPSSKFENVQAGRSLLFEQGGEEIEAQKAEGANAQHLVDQYNFLGGHRDPTEHHGSESHLSPKLGLESSSSMGGDEGEVDGGVIHDLELDDKSLPVQTDSVTDSSAKEADYAGGGSMKDDTTLRQFTDRADLYPVVNTEHENVGSSISSQVCQDTNDGGGAPTSENVDEKVLLGDHNSNVDGGDVTSFAQTEEAENRVSNKHIAGTVRMGEGEDGNTEHVEVASITPVQVKIGSDEKLISRAESTTGLELAPAQTHDSDTGNTNGNYMSHTAEDVENTQSRIEHERDLSEADANEFRVSGDESKAGVNDVAGEMDSSEAGSSENEGVPRDFDGEIPLNGLAHVAEADVISGDEESKFVETGEELLCVEKHHDSPGTGHLQMSPIKDDAYGDRSGEGDNAPFQENVHEDGLSCEEHESQAGGNNPLFLEEAIASEHLGDDLKLTEKAISCVPDEGNESNVPAISRSEASLHNDESERMLTSDHYSDGRLVAEDESMAGEEATELMDIHGQEETGTNAIEEEINFSKDREIVGAFSTLKPSSRIDDSDKAPDNQHGDQVGVSEELKELKLYQGKSCVPVGSEEEGVDIKHIINRTDLAGGGGENLAAVQGSKILIAGNDEHDIAITNDVDSILAGHIGDESLFTDCDLKLVDTGYDMPIQCVAHEASEQVEGAVKRKESEDAVTLDFDGPMASEFKDTVTGDASGDDESNRAEIKDITSSEIEEKEECVPEDIKDTSRQADHFSEAASCNAADSIPAVQRRYFDADNPFFVSGGHQGEVFESSDTPRMESDCSVEDVYESPAQVEDQSHCVASNHDQERAEYISEDSRSNSQGEVVERSDTLRKESDCSVEGEYESPAQVEDQSQCVASNRGQERAEYISEDSRSNSQGEVVERPDTLRKESACSAEGAYESPAQVEDQSQCVTSNHGQERAEYISEDSRSNSQGEVFESPDTPRKELDCSIEGVYEPSVASNHGQERAEYISEVSRSNSQGEVVESPDTLRKESDCSVEGVYESPAQVEDQSQYVASNHGQERAEYISEDSRSNSQGEVVEGPDTSRKESDSTVESNEGHERAEDNSEGSPSNDSPTIAATAPVEAETNIKAFHHALVANAEEENRCNNFGPQITDFGTEALKKSLSDSRHQNLSKDQFIEKGSDANVLQDENSRKPMYEETKLLSRLEQPGNGQMNIPVGSFTGLLHQKMSEDESRMFDSSSTTPAISSTQMAAPILLQPNNRNFDRDYRQHKSHMRQWRLKISRMCCYCCCSCSPTL